MRYRLLELLHDFASEKLRESGESQTARKQHFAYFKALADQWGTWASPDDEKTYLGTLAHEIPNMRAALAWSLSQPNVTPALELLSKVALYWQQHCNVSEARSWFARASAAAGGMKSIVYAKVLRRAATFATIEDDYSAARALTAQAMALFEELGDRAGVAEAVHNLAVIEDRTGSSDEAYRLYREALQAFEETGHEVGTITALFNLSLGCKLRGDFEQATAYLERGMSLCTTPRHADRLASFLKLRGEVALAQGALEEAAAALEQALSMKRALQNRHDEVEALCSVAALNIRRGDWEVAAHYASEGLRLAHQLEVPSLLIASLELFAVLFAKTGESERAQQVLALSVAMRRSHGYVYSNVDELRPELSSMSLTLPAQEVTREQIRRGIEQLIEP
jgi:tetratricopeptide (TPR) repeat protein